MKDIKETLEFGDNVLDESGTYLLPDYIRQDQTEIIVNCILIGGFFSFDGGKRPIKYNGRFGSRVFLNASEQHAYGNPKFVYDKKKDQWILMTIGYICFAEEEINVGVILSDTGY